MYDYDNDLSIPEESRKNMDLPAIEDAVRTILKAVGEHLTVLQECMQRSSRAFTET